MIKNKIFGFLQKYLAEYLFGFDKSQLEVAILSGHIDLKDVNFKPEKTNYIVNRLGLPLALKAGMIKKLQIKYHLMSWMSNPLDIIIDDLHLILGPNLVNISHDESYYQDEDPNCEYDDDNAYNIFEHNLRLNHKFSSSPFRPKHESTPVISPEKKEQKTSTFQKVLQNIRIQINGLHIRFEDDYFNSENPFAFGILCDRIQWVSMDNEWIFQSLELPKFNRRKNTEKDKIIKEINVSNFRVYWKSLSEMFIPTSLWESTKDLENQIFDAVPLEDLRLMMNNNYHDEYLLEPFNVFSSFVLNTKENALEEANTNGRPKFKMDILFTNLTARITPSIIDDMNSFCNQMHNFVISFELKAYRPTRKPITTPLPPYPTEIELRKRKLLARDWFFYVIWAGRINKLIKRSRAGQSDKSEKKSHKYVDILNRGEEHKLKMEDDPNAELMLPETPESEVGLGNKRLETIRTPDNSDPLYENHDAYLRDYIKKCEEQEKEAEKKRIASKSLWGSNITLRFQDISLSLFGKNEKRILVKQKPKPMFECLVKTPCLNFHILEEYKETNVLVKQVTVWNYIIGLHDNKVVSGGNILRPTPPKREDMTGGRAPNSSMIVRPTPYVTGAQHTQRPSGFQGNKTGGGEYSTQGRPGHMYQPISQPISQRSSAVHTHPDRPGNYPPKYNPPPPQRTGKVGFLASIKRQFFGGRTGSPEGTTIHEESYPKSRAQEKWGTNSMFDPGVPYPDSSRSGASAHLSSRIGEHKQFPEGRNIREAIQLPVEIGGSYDEKFSSPQTVKNATTEYSTGGPIRVTPIHGPSHPYGQGMNMNNMNINGTPYTPHIPHIPPRPSTPTAQAQAISKEGHPQHMTMECMKDDSGRPIGKKCVFQIRPLASGSGAGAGGGSKKEGQALRFKIVHKEKPLGLGQGQGIQGQGTQGQGAQGQGAQGIRHPIHPNPAYPTSHNYPPPNPSKLENKSKKEYYAQITIGNMHMDIFSQLIESMVLLYHGYKELYWFRDKAILEPIKRKVETKLQNFLSVKKLKGILSRLNGEKEGMEDCKKRRYRIHKGGGSATVPTTSMLIQFPDNENIIDETEHLGPKMINPTLVNSNVKRKTILPDKDEEPDNFVYKSIKKIDRQLNQMEIGINISIGALSLSCFEMTDNHHPETGLKKRLTLNSTPYFTFLTPPQNLSIKKQGQILNFSCISFQTTCSYSLPSLYFLLMSFKHRLTSFTDNPFLTRYITLYNTLSKNIERKKTVKFSKSKALKILRGEDQNVIAWGKEENAGSFGVSGEVGGTGGHPGNPSKVKKEFEEVMVPDFAVLVSEEEIIADVGAGSRRKSSRTPSTGGVAVGNNSNQQMKGGKLRKCQSSKGMEKDVYELAKQFRESITELKRSELIDNKSDGLITDREYVEDDAMVDTARVAIKGKKGKHKVIAQIRGGIAKKVSLKEESKGEGNKKVLQKPKKGGKIKSLTSELIVSHPHKGGVMGMKEKPETPTEDEFGDFDWDTTEEVTDEKETLRHSVKNMVTHNKAFPTGTLLQYLLIFNY